MSDHRVQVVGSSCGQHGSYTFYKAFSFGCGGGKRRVLALGEFFFARLWPTAPDQVCLSELQLVFDDSGSGERLACLRLYFLPEHTPDGRLDCHGEDEVLAVQEKLTVRLEELVDVVVRLPRWSSGWPAGAAHDPAAPPAVFCSAGSLAASGRIRLGDVERTKRLLGDTIPAEEPCVLVLSYDHYCRVRGVMKRLESVSARVYRHAVVRALGGVQIPSRRTRLLYCRDQFEYPELDCHEIFCNHLAPKLRGRSKKKAGSPPSSGSASDAESYVPPRVPHLQMRLGMADARRGKPTLMHSKPTLIRGLTPAKPLHQLRSHRWGEKEFLQRLAQFLKQRGQSLSRPPGWGLQDMSLYRFYRRVQELGGYFNVCSMRLWKRLFGEMGGNSAHKPAGATYCRRIFERLLLSFERYDRGLPELRVPIQPQQQPPRTYSNSAAAAGRRRAPAGVGDGVLSALAQTRPSITITPLPPSTPRQSVPAEPSAPDIEVIDLTSAEAAAPSPAVSVPSRPLLKPTRIGSITITPVGKAAPTPTPAAPAGSVEQLMALHMASTSLPPQMLQYMAGFPAGGGGKGPGLEQAHRSQQHVALQSLMAQRMTMMPSLPGMTKEQAQANVEAYQRMLQSNFNKS